ncbi:hypothetical protein [Photobacterium damselae]|uniref:hypothetical protein n=1 Tax=Photobacterium damselae TaxID=38293 RepID=UPI001F1EFAB9|nr:hypothetical protein [Photobacterium damselae]UKA30812.1 hypothetical protein IPQ37_18810 [Photobacterium damselae subsp. damselae]
MIRLQQVNFELLWLTIVDVMLRSLRIYELNNVIKLSWLTFVTSNEWLNVLIGDVCQLF